MAVEDYSRVHSTNYQECEKGDGRLVTVPGIN
jgi:hypothetical protein